MTARLHPPPSAAERNAWARGELKLSDDATPALARKQFYERLKESEFVPPESVVEAWDQIETGGAVAKSGEPRVSLAFAFSQPKKLLDEVEEFAKVFFDLAVAERESRYRRLAVECQCWPAAQARLQRLRPGLKLVWPDVAGESEALRELLGWMREVWVLPGPLATARRQAILAQVAAGEPNPMRTEAKRLRDRFGDCRALMPSFLEALDTQLPPAERQEAADVVFVEPAAATYSVQAGWTQPTMPARPMLPQVAPIPYQPTPQRNWFPQISIGVLVLGAILFFRVALSIPTQRPSVPPVIPPSYNVQPVPTRIDNIPNSFTPEEAERIRRIVGEPEEEPDRPLFNPSDPTRPIPRSAIDDPLRSPFTPPPPTNPTNPTPPRPFGPTPPRPFNPTPRIPTVPTPGPRFPTAPSPGGPRFP